jgi:3-mercaptopyruvate sulfurtransferase SseA
VARELIGLGFGKEQVAVLKGGWNRWLKEGYPLQKK